MIRTVVCEKNGCSGNRFRLQSSNDNVMLTCSECGADYEHYTGENDYIMMSNCSKCNNDIFKVFKDTEDNNLYVKCCECGAPPDNIYLDSDGMQVSYEGKLLNDIRKSINSLGQNISSLETKIEGLEGGQGILEESLAYINRYLVEHN